MCSSITTAIQEAIPLAQALDEQLTFSFWPGGKVKLDFDGGTLTSDAGLLPVRQFDEHLGLTERIAGCLQDPRQPGKVQHPDVEMLRQRLFQLIAGYEDCNDAQALRHDPTFAAVAGRRDLDTPLACQATLTRLENRVTRREIDQLNKVLLDTFIATRQRSPKVLFLDVDPTDDPCHGRQQLALFHGHFGQHMYHPLLVIEGKSGCILSAVLRRGTAPASEGAPRQAQRVVRRMQRAFPKARVVVRADAGFATPEMYELCEGREVEYVIGIGTNAVLQERARPYLEQMVARWSQTRRPQRRYTSFRYQAKTWSRRRRVVVKLECGMKGSNVRFVVTNMRGRAREVYRTYAGRGEPENRIKELKHGFSGDRLSCHRFLANAFRFQLSCHAYNLVHLFREQACGPELKRRQMESLRPLLLKVAARVTRTARRVCFHLCTTWPYAEWLRNLWRRISGLPPPVWA